MHVHRAASLLLVFRVAQRCIADLHRVFRVAQMRERLCQLRHVYCCANDGGGGLLLNLGNCVGDELGKVKRLQVLKAGAASVRRLALHYLALGCVLEDAQRRVAHVHQRLGRGQLILPEQVVHQASRLLCALGREKKVHAGAKLLAGELPGARGDVCVRGPSWLPPLQLASFVTNAYFGGHGIAQGLCLVLQLTRSCCPQREKSLLHSLADHLRVVSLLASFVVCIAERSQHPAGIDTRLLNIIGDMRVKRRHHRVLARRN
mmetsp:Transcript_43160/g.82323  ORF Transcript_43160/g.82323 Transcript_43160/m.82323 type:complete len:261 (-) Transcript_43160:157-939(-)